MDPDYNQAPGIGLPSPSEGYENASRGAAGQTPAGDASDALDQEWVDRAKDIVDKTRHDPFAQSRELSKVKAEYLKTRHNKEIKVDEEHS